MWATVLPIETERADMRLQWISRLLANPLLDTKIIMEPYIKHQLLEAAKTGQITLMMDQTYIDDRFAITEFWMANSYILFFWIELIGSKGIRYLNTMPRIRPKYSITRFGVGN